MAKPQNIAEKWQFGPSGAASKLAERIRRRWGLEYLDAYKVVYDLIAGGITWKEATLERTQLRV